MKEAVFFKCFSTPGCEAGTGTVERFNSEKAKDEFGFGISLKDVHRIIRRNKVGWVELYFIDHPNFLTCDIEKPLLAPGRLDVVDFENCGKPYKVEFFGKTQKEGVSEEIKKRMAEIEALVVPDNMTYLEEASFPPDDTLPEVVKARVEHVQKKAVSRVRVYVTNLIDERIKTCHDLPFSITKAEIEKAVPEFKGAFSSVVDMAKEHVKTLKEGDKHKYEALGCTSDKEKLLAESNELYDPRRISPQDVDRWFSARERDSFDLIQIYIEDKVPKPKDITEKQNEPAKSEEDAKSEAKKQKVDSGEHFSALWRICLDIGGKIERQDGPVIIEESDVKKLVPSYTGTFDLVYDTVKDYVNFRWAQYYVRREFINSRNPTRYGGGSDGSYDIFIEKKKPK